MSDAELAARLALAGRDEEAAHVLVRAHRPRDPHLFSSLDLAELQRALAALDAAPTGTTQLAAFRSLVAAVARLAFRIGLDIATVTPWSGR